MSVNGAEPRTKSPPVIVITGASAGIGWHTARALAKEGARLVIAAQRVDKLEECASHLRKEFGVEVLPVPADVGKRPDVRRMIELTVAKFGRIDVLINNAGILFMEPFERMTEETMRKLFETNFWSLVHTIQIVVPFLEKQGGGHIINVGSGVSRRGLAYMGAYVASKFALAGLTESVRLEYYSRHIFFTTVYPGGVDTAMPRSVDRSLLPPEYRDNSARKLPPERVAKAIVRAVKHRPLEVYVPWWLRYGAWLCLIIPPLADFIIRRHQRIR